MDEPTEIIFQPDSELGPDEFIDLLHRSTLALRRPVDEPDTIRAMLSNADVIITARCRRITCNHRLWLLHLSRGPCCGR
jgi:hypothetical protein